MEIREMTWGLVPSASNQDAGDIDCPAFFRSKRGEAIAGLALTTSQKSKPSGQRLALTDLTTSQLHSLRLAMIRDRTRALLRQDNRAARQIETEAAEVVREVFFRGMQ
jgi:hypothetical protein